MHGAHGPSHSERVRKPYAKRFETEQASLGRCPARSGIDEMLKIVGTVEAAPSLWPVRSRQSHVFHRVSERRRFTTLNHIMCRVGGHWCSARVQINTSRTSTIIRQGCGLGRATGMSWCTLTPDRISAITAWAKQQNHRNLCANAEFGSRDHLFLPEQSSG